MSDTMSEQLTEEEVAQLKAWLVSPEERDNFEAGLWLSFNDHRVIATIEELQAENAALRTRAEQAEHGLADRLKATIIPDAMRDAQDQIDVLRSEVGQLRALLMTAMDLAQEGADLVKEPAESPKPWSKEAEFKARVEYNVILFTDALSSIPLSAALLKTDD